jgi:hypothetical protein
MTTYRGCFGKVRSGPSGGAAGVVGEVRTWSFEETAERNDVSAIGTCTKKFQSGAKTTTGTLSVWWDPTDTRQGDFIVGNAVAVELYPAGTGSGSKYYKGVANIDSVSRSGGVDGTVESQFGFSVNGALTATGVP